MTEYTYSSSERIVLWCTALLGLVVVNGAFIYGLFRPELIAAAVENPLSLAFMTEAVILLFLLAYLLPKLGVSRMRRTWFVVLSLLGSLAFALPVALLYRNRSD